MWEDEDSLCGFCRFYFFGSEASGKDQTRNPGNISLVIRVIIYVENAREVQFTPKSHKEN